MLPIEIYKSKIKKIHLNIYVFSKTLQFGNIYEIYVYHFFFHQKGVDRIK